MSDMGRKSVGDQISDKVTPDSQKSTLDQAKESVSGAGDRVASAVQPEGDKSATQKASDSVRGGSDDAESQGKGVMQSVSDTVSGAAKSVQDTLSGNTNNK
ncbi:hypothetical protein W97_05485 [Coniosporium apollinis CBS 100218]|uniref:Chaperone/heat shock protein Hsp12 n=1 Tax=Coniosporium apollinis (strain CBS 100218) TaxID=1168221 RepID=R7YX19_CONA1|nr:uncharacterized protein W97_05485 [Coniosporium apollinis CBS 100218]EON66388.1 hypothetical protein W97_05485 [Coniosporium apollinis CBS 100218]